VCKDHSDEQVLIDLNVVNLSDRKGWIHQDLSWTLDVAKEYASFRCGSIHFVL
jgi:hypothetical protein